MKSSPNYDAYAASLSDQDRAEEAHAILVAARKQLEALYKTCRSSEVEDAIGRALDAWPLEAELYDVDLSVQPKRRP